MQRYSHIFKHDLSQSPDQLFSSGYEINAFRVIGFRNNVGATHKILIDLYTRKNEPTDTHENLKSASCYKSTFGLCQSNQNRLIFVSCLQNTIHNDPSSQFWLMVILSRVFQVQHSQKWVLLPFFWGHFWDCAARPRLPRLALLIGGPTGDSNS